MQCSDKSGRTHKELTAEFIKTHGQNADKSGGTVIVKNVA